MKQSRFLVTTALEETWRDGEPLLFLGEWCRLYSRQLRWAALDAQVLPYHWDDRAKLAADYRYLLELHERLLGDLAPRLNDMHGVDHGLRYWRILIGPWLGYFAQILFDRWTSVHAAAAHDLTGTVILEGDEHSLVPNDMAAFLELDISDRWNHLVYADVLQHHTQVACERQPRKPSPVSDGRRNVAQRLLRRGHGAVAGLLARDTDVFLYQTGLPRQDEAALCRRLGGPRHRWLREEVPSCPVAPARREWFLEGEAQSAFEHWVRSMIPRQLPVTYLEGYAALTERCAGLPWPRRPAVIFTGAAANSDEVFKAWAAEKAEQGAPLVLGQYGGCHGSGAFVFLEEHETAISDVYLSWGWTDAAKPKVHPVGQLKVRRPLGIEHARLPRALLVGGVGPRYSYHLYSVMVGPQWLDYFRDQCEFVEQLPEPARSALLVRLYGEDYGWDQEQRWRNRFPGLELDNGQSDMDALIGQSRLYIATYNATTFLESFTMNVPTVMFWNPAHWELRESAVPYWDALQRAGVFHDTPASAARHIGSIWHDVGAWWSKAQVQDAVERFKERFTRLPGDLLERVDGELRAAMSVTGALHVQASVSGLR